MRWVTKAAAEKKSHERGAAAIIVALLFAGGVAMGALAISVDVGNAMVERRSIQNGADAAVMALAASCGKGDVDACVPAAAMDPLGQLTKLAGANATAGYSNDGLTKIEGSCAQFVAPLPRVDPGFADCLAGDYSELTSCLPATASVQGGNYVEIRTETKTSDDNIMPKVFSQMLAGGGPNVTVRACARATWGAIGSYTGTVPVTFSYCEWKSFMDTMSDYPRGPNGVPGYGGVDQPAWPADKYDTVIYLANSDHSAPCTTSNGKDGPGGFGDLVAPGCQATVSTGGWVVGDNGKNITNDCRDVLKKLRGTVISIPVFDCLVISNGVYNGAVPSDCNNGTGGTYNYHIAGWAKFYLSGYSFPGAREGSYISSTNTSSGYPCKNSESCVSGWFLKGQLDATTIVPPGPNDFGTYAVLPAG